MTMVLTIATLLGATSWGGVQTGELVGMGSGFAPEGLYEINIDTGEAMLMHSFPFNPSEGALAVGPDGTLYAAFSEDIDQLVIVDPETGELTFVGPFGFDDVSGLAFALDGTLYGHDDTTCQLITIDADTGEGSAIGPIGFFGGGGLSFSSDGTLYAVGVASSDGVSLWTIDVATGGGIEVGPLGEGVLISAGLAFIGETLYAGATDEWGCASLYVLDPGSGSAMLVGGFSDCGWATFSMGGLVFLPGTGDADRDGDVDHDDFDIFVSCFTGPLDTKDPLPVECQFLDTDQDNDIDCDDWLDFVGAWTEEEDPPIFPPCEPCAGDANSDGTVDPLDSGFVLARFGCEVGEGDPNCDIADQNGDGLVDPLDVGFVLARFGPCP